MKHKLVAVFACTLVALIGCTPISSLRALDSAIQRGVAAGVPDTLSANEWALVKMVNIHDVEQVDWPGVSQFRVPAAALRFDPDGHIFGQVCNFITWRYSLLADGHVKVSPVLMTFAACEEPVMALESNLSRQISGALKVHIDADQDGTPRLTLRTSDGSRLVFSGRPVKAN